MDEKTNQAETPATTPTSQQGAPDGAALQARVTALEAELASERTARQAAHNAIVTRITGELFSGIRKPEILQLAPKLELDGNFQPTKESLAAVAKWKSEYSFAFADATTQTQAAPTAPATQPSVTQTPVVPQTPPVIAPPTMTRADWLEMRQKRPQEFRAREAEYVAWAKLRDAGKVQ